MGKFRIVAQILLIGAFCAGVPQRTDAGQSFSCSFGEPACLDYGAVVCKSSAMCVAKDAICFDSYTCDYKGFICKSKFDDTVEEYEDLRSKFNDLVTTANGLRDSLQSALDDVENTKRKLSDAEDGLASYSRCVNDASTLEEAKDCR